MKGRDEWHKTRAKGKGRESQRNTERLYYKFIAMYVQGKHPEIFDNAVKLHTETVKLNPGVFDLTKTTTFMAAVTPGKPIPRYYRNRKLCQQQQEQIPESEMVLKIPLLQSTELTELSKPVPEQEPVPVPEPELKIPILQSTELTELSKPVPEQEPVPVPEPELLPPEVYESLFNEIQSDPEMAAIFNGICNEDAWNNFGPDDNDGMNNSVWNDIRVQEMDLC